MMRQTSSQQKIVASSLSNGSLLNHTQTRGIYTLSKDYDSINNRLICLVQQHF